MWRRIASILTISSSLFLALTVSVALNVPLVSGSAPIIIKADGTVEGTTDIYTTDKVTYYVSADIFNSIVIERDNIVLNGAGYTVQGAANGAGITLLGIRNVTITNLEITAFEHGIYLDHRSTNISISGNAITANDDYGILLYNSSGNSIFGNTISDNIYGIGFYEASNNNSVSGNNVMLSTVYNLVLSGSANNSIVGNNVTNGGYGIRLFLSSDNSLYHNNFIDNAIQAFTYDSVNQWDNGYPSGGNYWSDYAGVDEQSGPDQNQPGNDGIGDTPYVVDPDNNDTYPLMKRWGPKRTEVGGFITEDSTWTIEDSPYLFVDDVTVSEGATLDLDPGVVVNLDLYSLIVENGTLQARGAHDNMIKIASPHQPLHAWPPRVHFADASTPWNETTQTGSIIEYAEITCVNDQTETIVGGSPKLMNNLILNHGNEAAAIRTNGIVAHNTILGGHGGIVTENGSILYNIIRDTYRGISASGIMPGPTQYPVIVGNLIIDNDEGISFSGPSCPYIANNTIVRNTYGFRFTEDAFYEGAMPVAILHNNLHSNTLEVLVEKEDSQININMTYNWWGTTDTSLIDQQIHDHEDNRRLSAVDYLPLLTSPCAGLDGTEPSTSHNYDGLWHNTNFVITLTATDDLSGIHATYYQVNSGPIQSVEVDGHPLITTEGADNSLEYWSVDNTGNEEMPHQDLTDIKLDKTPPTFGYLLINDDDVYTRTLNVTLKPFAVDSLSGVSQMQLSNDGASWTTWETYALSRAWNLSAGQGTKTVYVRYKDAAGVVSTTYSDTIIFQINDDDPPVTTIDPLGDGWFTSNVTVTLSATDDISGVEKTEYSFDNLTWLIYVAPVNLTDEGTTIIYYKSTDNAGNIEPVQNETLRIDKTAPSGSILINNGDLYTTSASVTLTLSAIDEASGVATVRFSNNSTWTSEPWEAFAPTKNWTLPAGDGTKTVYVQFNDTAGLVSSTYHDTIMVDTTPPTANAGDDRMVHEDTLVTLNGSASTDEHGIASYTWTFIDGILQTLSGENPTYTFTTLGSYLITLEVTDAAGNVANDTVTITVLDFTEPIAHAGPDQTVDEDTVVTFNASASFDNVGISSYSWTFTDAGTVQALSGMTPTYLFQTPGIYLVTLNVTDVEGNSSIDTVTITVLDTTTPTADAGGDRTVNEDGLVTLDGSASADNDAITSYTWTFLDVTTQTLTGETPVYTFNHPGIYPITLNVTDAAGNWATDSTVITVLDITSPIANAGTDQTVDEDTSVTLDASSSADNVAITSYTWTVTDVDGLHTLSGENPLYTFATPGTYQVNLNLTDAAGNWAIDTVSITVRDVTNPLAIAGPDQTVHVGEPLTLDASASADNMGIVSFEWNCGDGATGTGVTLAHTYVEPGTYTVTLTIRDAAGNRDTSTITITVVPEESLFLWIIGATVIGLAGIALAIAAVLTKKRTTRTQVR